jgi:hypothetical protein
LDLRRIVASSTAGISLTADEVLNEEGSTNSGAKSKESGAKRIATSFAT